jgi:DNA-binding NtrC family response regulator
MRSLIDMLRVFAQQEETILLSGPTGAGKSRLARFCHACSPRAQGAFETLDLTTVPEDLQMAELFGWRKGAFTGAVRDNVGCLGRAEGGTLFIDEIDKLSLKAQSGLLRVLEERTYRSLGESSGERQAQVRFIVGTNANLSALVRSGLFREDLFFRIQVLPVRVPPLSERRDEIVAWAEHMLDRRHRETGRGGTAALSPEAQRLLSAQPWPGNLRQLDNIVRRAYALLLVDHSGLGDTRGTGARDTAGSVVLDAGHVERALSFEGSDQPPRSLIDLMQAAAQAFVAEAERRRGTAPLDADLAEALAGFVYGVAAQKLGTVEDAFRLLGKDTLVQHRNHTKTLRRELQRVAHLYEVLGAGPSPFTSLVDPEKK